jgi:hypothetical protein
MSSLPLSPAGDKFRTSRPEQPGQAMFWLQAFIFLQIACQVALLFEAIGSFRIVVRVVVFGTSLALLAVLPPAGRPGAAHPARPWALAILGLVALEVFHPTTNTLLAALAQVGMYGAVLAPLFWVSRLSLTPALLRRLLLILWAFHTLSATVGVLQVYNPGRFQPHISTNIKAYGEVFLDDLKITLADGERVYRPMGLTDVPGGAATAGLYAVLFGVGFVFHSRSWAVRSAAAGSIGIGLFCIYLSQVRSVLIMAGICLIAFAVVLGRRGELSRLVGVAIIVPALFLASFSWAVSVGGETVTNRLASLTDDKFSRVYYRSRGQFLEHTVTTLLPEYPVGAGLGRWGMMNYYFGNNDDPDRGPIWAEIQWTAWLLDGGVPLTLLYSAAILVACLTAWRIAVRARRDTLEVWAALILAYNVGALAVTFNYPIFLSQSGLEFWLMNACLIGAAAASRRPTPPPAGARAEVGRQPLSRPHLNGALHAS